MKLQSIRLLTICVLVFALATAGIALLNVERAFAHGNSTANFSQGDDDDEGGEDDCDDDDDDGGDCDKDTFVSGQLVVKLNPVSGATIADINHDYNTTVILSLLHSSTIYLLQLPANSNVEEIADQMESDTRLLYAEPNFYGRAPEGIGRHQWGWAGTDPQPVMRQYAPVMLNLPAAHAISRGAGTIVAVLDTGFQLDHATLAGRWTSARYDFVDDDDTPDEAFAQLDSNGDGIVNSMAGHGTHVAGIVLMTAPDAQLMPLRVLDAEGRGNVFLIAEGILYAAENGAHIINMSLGTETESELLGDVIEDVAEAGVVVVAAAGNLASTMPHFPSAEEDVLAVAAVDENKGRAGFTNHGNWISVAAPGEQIYSGFPLNGYARWSGTSMAAPFVAGQAALLRSAAPDLSARAIANRILTSAEPLDTTLGAGLIDPVASLNRTDAPCECDVPNVNASSLLDDCDDNESDGDCDDDQNDSDDDCDDDESDGDCDNDGYQDDGLCDDDDDDGMSDPCEEVEVDVDVDDGGSITTDDNVVINFATGVVTTTTRFRYTETELDDEAQAIAPGAFGGLTFLLKALDGDDIRDDFDFSEPIQITVGYSDEDIAGIDEDDLMLYFRDRTADAWRAVSDTCADDDDIEVVRDMANNRLTVSVCHLTQFGLFGDLNAAGTIFLPIVRR